MERGGDLFSFNILVIFYKALDRIHFRIGRKGRFMNNTSSKMGWFKAAVKLEIVVLLLGTLFCVEGAAAQSPTPTPTPKPKINLATQETTSGGAIIIFRSGNLSEKTPVQLFLGGTARRGIDYDVVSRGKVFDGDIVFLNPGHESRTLLIVATGTSMNVVTIEVGINVPPGYKKGRRITGEIQIPQNSNASF